MCENENIRIMVRKYDERHVQCTVVHNTCIFKSVNPTKSEMKTNENISKTVCELLHSQNSVERKSQYQEMDKHEMRKERKNGWGPR